MRAWSLYRTEEICGNRQNTEIEFQERHCSNLAEHEGWSIVDSSYEYDTSRLSETLSDLIVRAEYGEFDVLLVYEFAVLGGSCEVAEFVETLQRHDVSVWSVNEGELRGDSGVDFSRSSACRRHSWVEVGLIEDWRREHREQYERSKSARTRFEQ
jgi:hypothetical protein